MLRRIMGPGQVSLSDSDSSHWIVEREKTSIFIHWIVDIEPQFRFPAKMYYPRECGTIQTAGAGDVDLVTTSLCKRKYAFDGGLLLVFQWVLRLHRSAQHSTIQ
jgi:hypothetical protein